MRFMGREFTGKGVAVAVVDSGANLSDPRLEGKDVTGWSIQLSAAMHVLLSSEFHDENGHGTDMIAALLRVAPDVKVFAVKIMGDRLRTSAELMAAGIETAARNKARVVNLSLGTPNMGKALLLRDCCANAVEAGTVVLAAAHPKGDRAYPADLPETVGVTAHPDCPLDKFFYFNPQRFPRKEWGHLSGKYLTHGYAEVEPGSPPKYKGSGVATAYLSGVVACMAEAMPDRDGPALLEILRRNALVPAPDIGYS
jgi:subtilisin family serine protease